MLIQTHQAACPPIMEPNKPDPAGLGRHINMCATANVYAMSIELKCAQTKLEHLDFWRRQRQRSLSLCNKKKTSIESIIIIHYLSSIMWPTVVKPSP